MKKYYVILIILIFLLSFIIYDMLEIDYMQKDLNQIIVLSGNKLILKENKRNGKNPAPEY